MQQILKYHRHRGYPSAALYSPLVAIQGKRLLSAARRFKTLMVNCFHLL